MTRYTGFSRGRLESDVHTEFEKENYYLYSGDWLSDHANCDTIPWDWEYWEMEYLAGRK